MPTNRILVVTDQLPYPPRNGVTLPLFHLVEQLRRTHRVQICLLQGPGSTDQMPWLADNEKRFGPILRVMLPRRGWLARLWREVAGQEMARHGWRAWSHLAPPGLEEAAHGADVLVSPISAVARWRAICEALPEMQPATQVALVSGCTAAEYRWRARSAAPGWRQHLGSWFDRLRAPFIARIEAALLRPYRRVLLQTEADRTAMRKLVGDATARRCRLAPNGVRIELFEVRPQRAQRVILVTELNSDFAPLMEWLAREVWPLVRARCPASRLTVIGRGASAPLRKLMASTPGITHIEYAPDIASFYAGTGVVWSPAFKGFGLINKTLEGMACGLPVVGGLSAFNGIAGFKNGVHGMGFDTPVAKPLADATVQLLQSPEAAERMGEAARSLVHGAFSWERAADVVRRAFDKRDPTVSRSIPKRLPTAQSLGR
jgi:glycosyltransferase involved in cell wall biosynthesis